MSFLLVGFKVSQRSFKKIAPGGPHLKLEAHLPAMDDNTIENSPEGPADRPIQNLTDSHRPQENTDLPELPGPSSLLRRLRQLQLNNLQKNIDDSYDAFDPIPSCSYDSLQSDNPPSGAHSQTSGEHHAAKRLLPQQKMRHDETRPKQAAASKPWKHYLEIHY